jgi:glycine betaine/proline transport system ATP-binding protein
MTDTQSNSPIISCRNLWKVFGDNPEGFLKSQGGNPSAESFKQAGYISAVNDVSFDLHQGEMLVVMGLSGSGKSTLVRCLSRLIEPTSGTIEIEGQDLRTMSDQQLIELRRHKMGMVFQNFALLPHKTVLENIAFPLQVKGISPHERRQRAMDMIDLVGLEGRENYFPRELSGGQQQRVGIARSLAVEPDIWLLDEPFSALDPLIRREMQDEFLRLQSMLNKTIVFITHDFDEALRLADRIAIMYHGKVEQIDTPENIVLKPATDYVSKFVKEVPRARVLTAQAVMEPINGTPVFGEPVNANATIESIARRVIEDGKAHIPVTNGSGTLVGQICRHHALDILFGKASSQEPAGGAV